MLSMRKIYRSNRRSQYSPCYKCPERIPGCHGKCEKYMEWKDCNYEISKKEYDGRRRQNNLREVEVKRTLAKKKKTEGKS